jgi:hypothetical protein
MPDRSPCEGSQWLKLTNSASVMVGPDRLILDNVSRFGLHRRHVICYGDLPDAEAWLGAVKTEARIDAWIFMDDCQIGHLWFCWKDKTT